MDKKLYNYKTIRPILSNNTGNINEITLSMEPEDEGISITASIVVTTKSNIRLINVLGVSIGISDKRQGFRETVRWIAPEISGLELECPINSNISMKKIKEQSTICLESKEFMNNDTININLKFTVWDGVQPVKGLQPFLYSDVIIKFGLSDTECTSNRVIIDIPHKAKSRSTQGNYTIAYPSQVLHGRRKILVDYCNEGCIELRYRFGWIDSIELPWVVTLKTMVALLMIAFISTFIIPINTKDINNIVFLMISTLVGFIYYVNDTLSKSLKVNLYKSYLPFISWISLTSTLIVVYFYILCVNQILEKAQLKSFIPYSHKISWTLQYSWFFVLLFFGFTVLSILLHYLGCWYSFRCDSKGCGRILFVRKGKKECHFTGRVLCSKCIESVCKNCVHYSDMIRGESKTKENYDQSNLLCIKTNSKKKPIIKQGTKTKALVD